MADGRHFEKKYKSPYLSNGLTDRHEILHDAHRPCEPYTQLQIPIYISIFLKI